jgi:hypothetical protein
MKAPNSPPFGLRLRPDSRAFAQDSPGRRRERRATRGVETGGSKKPDAAGALFGNRVALMNNAGQRFEQAALKYKARP